MVYHIDTIPIWDAFKKDCECPLCVIEDGISARLTDQYLNEAVMEPAYRIEVNKYGFCKAHFEKLLSGKNKLGLTLQTQTRMEYAAKNFMQPAPPSGIRLSAKSAKKTAEKINAALDTCVICSQINRTMDVYYETVARMFVCEKAFPALINDGKGFCMKHYAGLMANTRHGGDWFAGAITTAQHKALLRLQSEMQEFADKFDAHKQNGQTAAVTTAASTALQRAINKLI